MKRKYFIVIILLLVFYQVKIFSNNSFVNTVHLSATSNSYENLVKTLGSIGERQMFLHLGSGKWIISQSIEIPRNIQIDLERGAFFFIKKEVV